ncbi:dihydrolipoyllysine-residue acetyltransferase [Malassezia cuniculi]|uniref:Dihydrolipoyllysine-residue acetyltransferase n=1 Tax=Malassezia cuniculi TaxID=948313 RepID=A0AAF0EV66_9BASI|nr:dihydrolipoyllysine-residue acetyltransferase [Malassezia cuniculi]
MPAMSPTMEQGNVVDWKVKEGGEFHAGDILLSIETDKATMDVEAQDDGIMGKIIAPAGSKDVPVNKIIALLAEEGDDISDLKVPDEAEAPASETPSATETPAAQPSGKSSTSSTQPTAETSSESAPSTAARPHFPSVQRLLEENSISDAANKIKPTGPHGMITKGDVLAYLGKARTPFGTSSPERTTVTQLGGGGAGGKKTDSKPAPKAQKPLTGDQIRSQIMSGLGRLTHQEEPKPQVGSDWDAIVGPYL